MKKEIQTIKNNRVPEIAQVYGEVFAGPPWLEVSTCSQCGSFASSLASEKQPCNCGGVFVLPAYPIAETSTYIRSELAKQSALAFWLAVGTGRLQAQGFGWGYQSTSQGLAEQKYKTAEMQSTIQDLLLASGAFFYISEVGVLPISQGEGWGKALTSKLVNESRNFPAVVLRTNEDSPMRYISEKLGMKPIVGLKSGIPDNENEARVLFVGTR